MYCNPIDTERSGDVASMLTTSAPKRGKNVVRSSVALGFCQGTYGSAHGLIRNGDEAASYLMDAKAVPSSRLISSAKALSLSYEAW